MAVLSPLILIGPPTLLVAVLVGTTAGAPVPPFDQGAGVPPFGGIPELSAPIGGGGVARGQDRDRRAGPVGGGADRGRRPIAAVDHVGGAGAGGPGRRGRRGRRAGGADGGQAQRRPRRDDPYCVSDRAAHRTILSLGDEAS